jgi:hypothetical protein
VVASGFRAWANLPKAGKAVFRRHGSSCLILCEARGGAMSPRRKRARDPTYAEVLHATFGLRVLDLQISRNGDGMNVELRPVKLGQCCFALLGGFIC